MNRNTVVRHSFATGVVSPGIRSRTDWDRHGAAVQDAVNFVVGPAGEMRKRPGFRLVGPALHDDKPVRLVEFAFSLGQTYMLEFGDGVMRFHSDVLGADGRVERGMVMNDDGTPYVLATPYTAEQAQAFTFAQDKDAMFFAHWDRPLHVLTRRGHARWEWTRHFDGVPDRVRAPERVTFYDPASNGHNGYEYTVTAARNVNGALQESLGGYSVLASGEASHAAITQAPHNDIQSILAWKDRYAPLHGRLPGFPDIPDAFDLRGIPEDASPPGGAHLHPKIFAVWKLKYPSAGFGFRGRRALPHYEDVFYQAFWGIYHGNEYPEHPSDHALWYEVYMHTNNAGALAGCNNTLFMLDNAVGMIDNNEVSVNGMTKDAIHGAITGYIARHNDENAVKASNRVLWTPSAGADRYYVYRRPISGDNPDFLRIADLPADTLDFLDASVEDTVPAADTPPAGESGFDDPLRYPAIVTFYQQRLVLGATKEKPTTVWGSTTGIYADFTVSLAGNAQLYSSYEFKMASRTSDPLKAVLPLRTLYILTSGGAFVSTVSGAMNASNVNFNQEAYGGASDVPPLVLDKLGLYAPVGRQTINALAYDFAADGFDDDNLLFHAQHLTEGKTIAGLAHLRSPVDLVFAPLSDGSLISCTFIPGQGFRAWTRHETRGSVLSVASHLNDDGQSELWAVVERVLGDGTRRRFIEVLEDMRPFGGAPTAENAFYVDCGLSARFDGPTSAVTGLEHLEGLEVAVLADFSVQSPKTVRNGRVELDNPATRVHVGLPYEASLRTLDLEPQGAPTLRGTRRRVYRAQIEVERTRDLSYSVNGGDEYDMTFTTGADLGLPPGVVRGDVAVGGAAGGTDGTWLELRSRHPLPCTVNSIVAEVQYAG